MNINQLEKIHNPDNRVWRDNIMWRSTSTGINKNVIGTYAPYNQRNEIIKHVKANITPYTDGRKYLDKKEFKYNQYFVDVVNDCMLCIWSGMRGYVFDESQLREIVKILPSVQITYSETDKCYWCRK